MRSIVPCLALLWPLAAARAESPPPQPPPAPAPTEQPAPVPTETPASAPSTDPAPAPEGPTAPAPAPAPEEPPSPAPATAPEEPTLPAPEKPTAPAPAPAAEEPAAPTPTEAAPPAPRRRQGKEAKFGGSFTISPLHFLVPMVELTGEMTLTSKHSLALVLGVGWLTATTTPTNPFESPQTVRLRALNAGGQYRFYAIGNFDRGVSLGTEILLSDFTGQDYADTAGTWSLLLGGKYAFPFGLTFDLQVGPGLRFTGGAPMRLRPTFNANVGWSFVFHRKAKRAAARKAAASDDTATQPSGEGAPVEGSDDDGDGE